MQPVRNYQGGFLRFRAGIGPGYGPEAAEWR